MKGIPGYQIDLYSKKGKEERMNVSYFQRQCVAHRARNDG